MDHERLRTDILGFVGASYPNMEVRVEPWPQDPTRTAIWFVESKFALIYPAQRYHYLLHLIPEDYYQQHLSNSIWLEVAPGEAPEDLRYPDPEVIEEITPHVMKCVLASRFFQALDDLLCPISGAVREGCHGDYRHSRPLLLAHGFTPDELFDVFHVLMAQGGYCDCEILYNVVEGSRLASEYWKAKAEGKKPYDPHDAG